ncbi:MAG: ferrous iron transport protein A [Candidatus Solibacter usitatus]|nr:ferrous iron transport protein A [Candidatus Solibacter usitatus]
MQLSSKKKARRSTKPAPLTLAELQRGESAILESLDVDQPVQRRLMELGFLPGHVISAGRSAPGGDPRVFLVDGSEVALRRETACQLRIRRSK